MSKERTELGKLIEAGLEEAIAYERGETTGVRVTRRRVTARSAKVAPPPEYEATDIQRIRGRMDLSQPVFADALGVSAPTVRAWEQGKRVPDPPARRLLQIAENSPAVFMKNVRPMKKGGTRIHTKGLATGPSSENRGASPRAKRPK